MDVPFNYYIIDQRLAKDFNLKTYIGYRKNDFIN